MSNTMQAAVLYGKEDLRMEQIAIPPIGAGEMLLRVRAALTCGTDVKVFRRGYHARMIAPPSGFGHEAAGEVAAVGYGVRTFSPGDRVVVSNSAPCYACFFCGRGQQNLCENLVFNNGAYAEFLRIPAPIVEKNAYHLPRWVSFADAALMEPLACVVQGLNDTALRAGEFLTVIGLGPIGMMFVKLGKARGARVIAVGRRQEQVDRALALGADFGIAPEGTDAAIEHVRRITERGTDVTIEAVGKPELWTAAVRMLRRGGRANFFGGCPHGADVSLPTELLHYSGLQCVASFHHTPQTNQEALAAIVAGHVTSHDFVGAQEPLSRTPDVLRQLTEQNAVLKTAILP